MAGRGPAPKPVEERRGAHLLQRGEWKTASVGGWQHGPTPRTPTGLTKAARDAWRTWFGSWFAAFWTPADLPALRQLVRLYDAVEEGQFQRHGELRLAMDTYGITPKGQQDRRWAPPKVEKPDEQPGQVIEGRWSGLKVADGT